MEICKASIIRGNYFIGTATVAVSQSDIDALNAAIASGTRMVTLGGQTITYQTTESLIKARDDMADQLRKQNEATTGKRSKQTLAYYAGRGYN